MATQSLGTGSGLNQLVGNDRDFLLRVFLENRYPMLTAAIYGRNDGIQMNEGDSIKWPTMSKAGRAKQLAEGADAAMSDFTTSGVTATLKTYGDGTDWSRDLEEHGLLPVVAGFASEFAMQQGQEMDIQTLEELDGSSNVIWAGGNSADGDLGASDVATGELFKDAALALDKVSAPKITQFINPTTGVDTRTGLPAYVAFASPNVVYDLRSDADFVSVEKYQSGNMLLPGEIGSIEEVRIVKTNNASELVGENLGTGNVDVEHIPVIAAGAFGIASLNGRNFDLNAVSAAVVNHANKFGQVGFMSWTDKWAVKRIREDHIYVLRCAASKGNNT